MLNYRRRGQNHRITDWKNGGLRNKAKSSVISNDKRRRAKIVAPWNCALVSMVTC